MHECLTLVSSSLGACTGSVYETEVKAEGLN